MMGAAVQASGLGKQYRRTWALRDCTLAIPGGRVVGQSGGAVSAADRPLPDENEVRQINRDRTPRSQ
jgi:hypothetical protein